VRFQLAATLGLALAFVACGQDTRFPQTDAFDSVVRAGASNAPLVFSLEVLPLKEGDKIYLFCRLKNMSNEIVRIDDSYLPWNTLGQVTAIAFDARGKQLRTNLSMGGIFSEGNVNDLKPGEEVSGRIDLLAFLNPDEWPAFGDVELRWVYLPKLEGSDNKQRAITGRTHLPRQLR
jgi:hypothetical protein